jgi:hypothetical protein
MPLNSKILIVIEGVLRKKKCGTIIANKDSVLGNPLS